jgi:hypothetical protein
LGFHKELIPSTVVAQTFRSAMALQNSLFFMFHQSATYNAAKSPKTNGAANTQGCYQFCQRSSEGAVNYDGAAEFLTEE